MQSKNYGEAHKEHSLEKRQTQLNRVAGNLDGVIGLYPSTRLPATFGTDQKAGTVSLAGVQDAHNDGRSDLAPVRRTAERVECFSHPDPSCLVDRSLAVAGRIVDTYTKARALLGIAELQTERGNRSGALDTVQAAFAAYTEVESAHDWHDTLRMIAAVQIKAGDLRGSLATLDALLEVALLAGSHGGGSASAKARALADMAVVQKEAGDGKGASATFETALATAEAISDADEAGWALTEIASAQARAGDSEAARGTLEMIGSAAGKARALGILATTQVEAGDRQGARKTIEAALANAGKVRKL